MYAIVKNGVWLQTIQGKQTFNMDGAVIPASAFDSPEFAEKIGLCLVEEVRPSLKEYQSLDAGTRSLVGNKPVLTYAVVENDLKGTVSQVSDVIKAQVSGVRQQAIGNDPAKIATRQLKQRIAAGTTPTSGLLFDQIKKEADFRSLTVAKLVLDWKTRGAAWDTATLALDNLEDSATDAVKKAADNAAIRTFMPTFTESIYQSRLPLGLVSRDEKVSRKIAELVKAGKDHATATTEAEAAIPAE